MKAQELDTKDAGFFKYAALMDARAKSWAASTFYSEAQKLQAERMRLGLELVYNAKVIFITYRKKFIVVKVDNARVRDKQNLELLEKGYEMMGITKVVTPQGVTYRIPKA